MINSESAMQARARSIQAAADKQASADKFRRVFAERTAEAEKFRLAFVKARDQAAERQVACETLGKRVKALESMRLYSHDADLQTPVKSGLKDRGEPYPGVMLTREELVVGLRADLAVLEGKVVADVDSYPENHNKWKQLDYVQAGMLARYKTWRAGQGLFNALVLVVPELAEEIRGGDLDPFYDNSRIQKCLKFVRGRIFGEKA
jgi:hypothetical protein